MTRKLLDADGIRRALALRDLTDPAWGPHAMQQLVDGISGSLAEGWGCEVQTVRESPIVSIRENYDRLHYPPDSVARESRYTRYVNDQTVLRTQTSAMIPVALSRVRLDSADDVLLVCPGLVYRRDVIDRLHTGEPHQLDVWRIARRRLGADDLLDMVDRVVTEALPGRRWRTATAEHPYTVGGLQIDVADGERWVEIGECGLALPGLLAEAGHDPSEVTGLAMGLGLDRLLMLRKGIGDIRLLRSGDPRVAEQMLDLRPYRAVSNQPAVPRDLSVAVVAGVDAEELGERVRARLGSRAEWIESVEILSQTPQADLPAVAIARLGLKPGQENALVRVILRHPTQTLTSEQANELRDEVYAALHEGTVWTWASARRRDDWEAGCG